MSITPFDLERSLDGIVLLLDTREQDTPKLRQRINKIGWPVERKKLDFGDYSAKVPMPDGSWLDMSDKVSIERKMDFTELASCYCGGRKRFSAEFERARSQNAKLYLLIEEASWEKAYGGSYRSKMSPQSLVASMLAWLARYNCQLVLCERKTSALLIRDILYREAKELLEAQLNDGDGRQEKAVRSGTRENEQSS